MSSRPLLLAGGAFAVGTSAYVITGILPAVSAELGVSITTAGQLSTVFALAYAISAPVLATVAGRLDRRTLLVAALVLAGVGNAVSALATTYPLLLGSRIISALGAAAFTPAATVVATQLMPPHRRGSAVALVFGGLTFALVLGVPMGTLLGAGLGYRGVFAIIALVCFTAAIAMRAFLPQVSAPPVIPLRERFAVVRDARVLTVLGVTVFGVLSAMSVYVYAVPFLAASAGVTGPTVGVLLLVYGLGALLGNFLGGRATDRFGSKQTLITSMLVFLAVVATLPITATSAVGAGAAFFVWSIVTWTFNPPIQHLLLGMAPAHAGGLRISINASAIYLGAGLSGAVGGLVISSIGVLTLPLVATALMLVALALLLVGAPHRTRERQVEVPTALASSG
ncbi:MFS transporter [Actinomycetes bacterium KLBMP 9759]